MTSKTKVNGDAPKPGVRRRKPQHDTTTAAPLAQQPSPVEEPLVAGDAGAPEMEHAKPAEPPTSLPAPGGKLGVLVALLKREGGAGIDELTQATGWQAHSVRGAIAGSLKKKLGLTVCSEKSAEGRIYRIVQPGAV